MADISLKKCYARQGKGLAGRREKVSLAAGKGRKAAAAGAMALFRSGLFRRFAAHGQRRPNPVD